MILSREISSKPIPCTMLLSKAYWRRFSSLRKKAELDTRHHANVTAEVSRLEQELKRMATPVEVDPVAVARQYLQADRLRDSLPALAKEAEEMQDALRPLALYVHRLLRDLHQAHALAKSLKRHGKVVRYFFSDPDDAESAEQDFFGVVIPTPELGRNSAISMHAACPEEKRVVTKIGPHAWSRSEDDGHWHEVDCTKLDQLPKFEWPAFLTQS